MCEAHRSSVARGDVRHWHTVPGDRKTWRVIDFVCETPFTV
jgi:hypothetical protein